MCEPSSTVFRFVRESLSLWHPEDFFLCMPVAHPCLHEGKDQFIHELIDLRELACDFVLVHSERDWQISI